ncbi:Zinc finger C2H2 [Penicillium hispanicum]|uniref:Zinc finger C2H2 n=1 Tax=Penicillium hispanicum TaxID=1080232 RepID=UPI0025400DF8|nr:Zinc finger C2H2 [Penicillium hispanicum]KAJ5584834.1 Zinc finger C2H2 [Penicillium hispanicum]
MSPMNVGLVFNTSNMDQTPDSGRRSSSMVPSLLEDAHSLEPTSAYSSPLSATPSHGGGFPSTVGLGISGCGLELPYDHLRAFPNQLPFSVASNIPNQLASTDSLYSVPLKIDDYSNRMCYDVYNTLPPDTSHSPLSWYGSRSMSASPGWNSPIDVGPIQRNFPGQTSEYWAPVPETGPTTASDATSLAAGPTTGDYWNQQYFPEACVAMNAPALPFNGNLPVVGDSLASTSTVTHDIGSTRHPSRPTRTLLGSPSPQTNQGNPGTLPKPHQEYIRRSGRKDKGYACSHCGSTFTRRSNCAEHEKRHNPSYKQSFPCDECGKTFGRNADLKRHTDTVSETITSTKRKQLLMTIQVHRKIRKHGCHWCDRRFSRTDALNKHLSECERSFAPISSSHAHQETEDLLAAPAKHQKQASRCWEPSSKQRR